MGRWLVVPAALSLAACFSVPRVHDPPRDPPPASSAEVSESEITATASPTAQPSYEPPDESVATKKKKGSTCRTGPWFCAKGDMVCNYDDKGCENCTCR